MKIMHRERICSATCFILIAVVFLVGCLSLIVLPAAAESDGSIRIYSNPPGSGACLDSTDNSGNCIAFDSSGFAEFYNIAGGSSHTVSVFLDGYQTSTTTVYVPEGQEVELHADLQPNPSVTTSPIPTSATTTTRISCRASSPRSGTSSPVAVPATPTAGLRPNHRKRERNRFRNCNRPSDAHNPGRGAEGDRRLLLSLRFCLRCRNVGAGPDPVEEGHPRVYRFCHGPGRRADRFTGWRLGRRLRTA